MQAGINGKIDVLGRKTRDVVQEEPVFLREGAGGGRGFQRTFKVDLQENRALSQHSQRVDHVVLRLCPASNWRSEGLIVDAATCWRWWLGR